jgi:hypothetical protein
MFQRRHSCALAASKRRTIRVVLGSVLGTILGARVVLSRLLSARRLHLLPCCEDIRPRLCILRPRVWFLSCWWRSEVLAREPVCACVVCVVVLRRGRALCLRRGFRWRRAIVGPTGGGCGVGVPWRRRRSRPWCVRRVRGNIQVSVLPPLRIVLCALGWVAEYFVRSLNLLKLHHELDFAPGVAIRVVLQRKRSEGLADLIFAGVRRNFQVGVVISRRIGFDHGGGGRGEGLVDEMGRELRSARTLLSRRQPEATCSLGVCPFHCLVACRRQCCSDDSGLARQHRNIAIRLNHGSGESLGNQAVSRMSSVLQSEGVYPSPIGALVACCAGVEVLHVQVLGIGLRCFGCEGPMATLHACFSLQAPP